MEWKDETEKLRDEIITDCTAWSVPYLLEKMNKLIHSAYSNGMDDGWQEAQTMFRKSR